ncbi:MAG TPA: hypothetical protein VHO69_02730 [Phototrophicaceae bacterium]|nr:hypothetical protein [Phototrophicaceae bacterium]
MGVDWFQMRPKTTDIELLKQLIEAQAFTGRQCMGYWVDPDNVFNGDRLPTESEREAVKQKHFQILNQLEALITIEPYDPEGKNGSSQNCSRVYPIIGNHFFPAEWRIADARTILPEELPDFYSRWRNHIQAVRTGQYRGYLFEWYLYAGSLKVNQFWCEFRGIVSSLPKRENAWAERMRVTALPQQIMELPPPPVYPPPRWADWSHDPPQSDPHNDPRYLALIQANEARRLLNKAWNSRVARNAKYTPDVPLETFDKFVGDGKEGWVDEFLVWVAECIEKKFGLFFDW